MKKPQRTELTLAPHAAGNTAAALGINKKRQKELDELIDSCYEETSTYPEAMARLSFLTDNQGEFAYVVFHLGAFAERQQAEKAAALQAFKN